MTGKISDDPDKVVVGTDKFAVAGDYGVLASSIAIYLASLSQTLTNKTIASAAVTVSSLAPAANDGAALGSAGARFSDIFLASGGVINAGGVTVTHATNLLEFAGASSGYKFDAGICVGTGTSASGGLVFDGVKSNASMRVSGLSNNDQVLIQFQHQLTGNDQIWQFGMSGSTPATGFANRDFVLRDGGANAFFGITYGGVVKLGAAGATATVSSTALTSLKPLVTPLGSATLANGLNSNIATPTTSFVRLTGPTGAFSVGGFTGGVDGYNLTIYNATAQAMTIVNEDASSTAGNRIKTLTGGNVVLRAGTSAARLIYDATDFRWVLLATN